MDVLISALKATCEGGATPLSLPPKMNVTNGILALSNVRVLVTEGKYTITFQSSNVELQSCTLVLTIKSKSRFAFGVDDKTEKTFAGRYFPAGAVVQNFMLTLMEKTDQESPIYAGISEKMMSQISMVLETREFRPTAFTEYAFIYLR